MSVDIDEALEFANLLADAARSAILPYFRAKNGAEHGVENKGQGLLDFDPVTKADRAAENAMRNLIFAHRPNDGIIGEEFGIHHGSSGWVWVLDPIDGTRAFMAGTSSWGVLIGGYFDAKPLVGVMDQPFTRERWAAKPLASVWMRDGEFSQIKCNKNARLENSVISTTDPFLFSQSEAAAFAELRAKMPIVRYGLDCTAYGLLAMGGIGLVVETGLKLVDIGALIPIIEGAGGIVTDWRGNKNPNGGQVVAAANAIIHKAALAVLMNAAD